MSSLFARRDVVVVASVSCIYGIGSREDYEAMLIHLHAGQAFTREQLLEKLIALQYNRNDITFERGQFRVCGDNGKKDSSAFGFQTNRRLAVQEQENPRLLPPNRNGALDQDPGHESNGALDNYGRDG